MLTKNILQVLQSSGGFSSPHMRSGRIKAVGTKELFFHQKTKLVFYRKLRPKQSLTCDSDVSIRQWQTPPAHGEQSIPSRQMHLDLC